MTSQPDPAADQADINVLLVDDQELVRTGLRRILRRRDGFTIVGEASDGSEVLRAVAQYQPNVVVMDLRMRNVSGIEATRQLTETNGPPVLALTTFHDDELLAGVLRAGANGFVLKDSSAEELIRAVRAVANGHSYLDPAVTARVLHTYRHAPESKDIAAQPRGLTTRETEVIRLIARGLTNLEIADNLGISATTVKTHIRRIFAKLDLRDRTAAVVYAYEYGIVIAGHDHEQAKTPIDPEPAP